MYSFKEIKLLINENIYIYLFNLMKSIFFTEHNSYIREKIKHFNDRIKEKYHIEINETISKQNLINILKFVKNQNKLYAAEILENILIIIFSYSFKEDEKNPQQYNTIGKYVHKNLLLLKETADLENWFDYNKININIKSIHNLLENDILFDESMKKNDLIKSAIQKEIILYDFLYELKKEKTSVLKLKKNFKHKFINYLNGEKKIIYNNDNNGNTVKFENSTTTKITQVMSAQFYDKKKDENRKGPLGLAKSFLISTYIYYQNKHSPLMKFIKEKDDPDIKPFEFEYDLKGATIENEYAGIIIPPARVEPRISIITLDQNLLKEKGFFELGKLLIFNKNIKHIEFNRSGVKSYYLNYLLEGLGMFDNYSIETLSLTLNYLKNDSESYLCNILSHLKGLKTINLSHNELSDGISAFLIVLKKLYRQKKINLENLILNDCSLDELSFYELGELLKSKYCKLKNLYLNSNNIALGSKFLKKLKKNKSLTEIYFNGNNLGKRNTDDIMRVISNTEIESLSLYKNKFLDFDDCLRILYRTKLVLNKEEEKKYRADIPHNDSILYNLDLSLNQFLSKNTTQIDLLKNIIKDTTLYCIDLSWILFGKDPNEVLKDDINNSNNNEYQKSVYELKKYLDKEQREYKLDMEQAFNYKVDKEKFENLKNNKKEEYDEYLESFEKFDKKILDLIKDKRSIYPLFLRKEAKELFDKNKGEFGNKKPKDIKDKLVEYMIYKRASENFEILDKKKEKNKLILI